MDNTDFDETDLYPSSSKSFINKPKAVLETNNYEKLTFKLKLRFQSGKDLEITINGINNTFKNIKDLASKKIHVEDSRYIRLIYQGKILKEDNNVFELIEKVNKEQDIATESISSHLKYGSTDHPIPLMYQSNHGFIGSLNSPIVIQAMILESLPNNEEPELKQIVPSTGFDRLREAGFSEQDIHQLRQQFQMAHNIDGTTNDPEEQDRNRRLEEAWIDNTNQTLPDGIAIGCYYQMVQGMVLGFFGSFIAVVFISDKMFTRYQQLGLAFGFLINIGFGCILAIQ